MPDLDTERALDRRDLLRGSLAFAGIAPLCCSTPELAAAAFQCDGQQLKIDLRRAPELRHPGMAAAIVDAPHKLNLIVAHVRNGEFAVLNRACTHGGAMCTYNHKRKTVRCTSLNHAEFDLQGTLLHGRTHGNLKRYASRLTGSELVIALDGRA